MELCPKCFSDDDVVRTRGADGRWSLTCGRRSRHDDGRPHTWSSRHEAQPDPVAPGPGFEPFLGPLRRCLVLGEPFVEYGVVEWRLRRLAPRLFVDLVAERGHRVFSPRPEGRMASSHLALALSLLVDRGQAAQVKGMGTGLWHERKDITYWAALPAPPTTQRLTWGEFAHREGLEPQRLIQAA